MSITYLSQEKRFLLETNHSSYIMELAHHDFLSHVYWGKKITNYHGSNKILYRDRGFCPNINPSDRTFSLDTLPQEYPQYGNGDYRPCAYQVKNEQNETFSDIRYVSHEIYQGKQPLQQLPSSYADEKDVETLIIHMQDKTLGLSIDLYYHVFPTCDVITRYAKFHTTQPLTLTKMLSASVDFRRDDFDLVTMYGAHNNDRNLDRRPLTSATTVVESMRGASSPHQTPFLCLCNHNADEQQGEVYTMQFVYSGNFHGSVHVDPYRNVRMQIGLQPFDCEWHLSPNEIFETPEVVMTYTDQGFNQMSKQLHTFVKQHIIRGIWKDKQRPILFNSWESLYFDIREDKLLEIADTAADLGIELFVLDDGWFKGRNDDNSSLGDWVCDTKKLPHGIAWLSEQIHQRGMQFGIWVEPEMISEDSDLYRAHPEYALQIKDREHVIGRGQLVLDLTSSNVRDYVVESICNVLRSAKIEYVKWDMNRHLTNIGSLFLETKHQRETAHRYMLGVYDIMQRITQQFPDILFESCSSGGGRFDLGMLCYMPQTWTSDNTDAICRTKIQYATSYMMPAITMGSHVSVCPNHQTGRITPMSTRFAVAMSGRLGYELDLTKIHEDEIPLVKQQIALYKQYRPLVQHGTMYRLKNPFTGNEGAWCFVNDKNVLAIYIKTLSEPAAPFRILRLQGLEEDALYQLNHGDVYSGSELMYAGISIPNTKEDFHSEVWYFTKL